MSLIDPVTPEGFFHMRLVPYKLRLLEEGRTLFPEKPDPDRDSYFEDPLVPAKDSHIQVAGPSTLTGKHKVTELRSRWVAAGEDLLFDLSEDLEAVRRTIVEGSQSPENDDVISDFVYPLF